MCHWFARWSSFQRFCHSGYGPYTHPPLGTHSLYSWDPPHIHCPRYAFFWWWESVRRGNVFSVRCSKDAAADDDCARAPANAIFWGRPSSLRHHTYSVDIWMRGKRIVCGDAPLTAIVPRALRCCYYCCVMMVFLFCGSAFGFCDRAAFSVWRMILATIIYSEWTSRCDRRMSRKDRKALADGDRVREWRALCQRWEEIYANYGRQRVKQTISIIFTMSLLQ